MNRIFWIYLVCLCFLFSCYHDGYRMDDCKYMTDVSTFKSGEFPFLTQSDKLYKLTTNDGDTSIFDINKTTFSSFFLNDGDCNQKVEVYYYTMADTIQHFTITQIMYSAEPNFSDEYGDLSYYDDGYYFEINIKLDTQLIGADSFNYPVNRHNKLLKFSSDSGLTKFSDTNQVILRIK